MRAPGRYVPFAALLAATAQAQQPLDWLSPDLARSLREAVVEAAYSVTEGEGPRLEASNPAQGLHSGFSDAGLRLSGHDEDRGPWSMSLTLEAWGREGALQPVEPAAPVAQGRRVEYRRGPLTEWYVNDPRGVEQGFTIEAPPGDDGPLRLALEVGGDLSAEVLPGERDALFRSGDGRCVVHYSGLRVWDAAARELDASLAIDGDRIVLRVDDEAASYPLYIDPWIVTEEAQLAPSAFNDEVDSFGEAIAVSGDTAVVGYPEHNFFPLGTAGGVFVFVRQGTTWSEETMLLPNDPENLSYFGSSVAISGDTVVVGAKFEDALPLDKRGAAYVFVRSGSTWAEQAKLTASDAASGDLFGFSVSVSGDTAVIGAPYDEVFTTPGGFNQGSAYVFMRSGTNWTEEAKLIASDAEPESYFGWSVAVSSDTAMVGAVQQDWNGPTLLNPTGKAYVFTGSGASWVEQQILTSSDAAGNDCFGVSVALSGDTALIGAYTDDNAAGTDAGSAYLFLRSGATWNEGAKLLASDAAGGDNFGYSVALSGNAAVVGAPEEDEASQNCGAAYVFTFNGGVWSEQAKLTIPSGGLINLNFGSSTAIFEQTALVGRPRKAPGEVRVYRLAPTSQTYCTPGTSASGCQAAIAASGVASASASSGFQLLATGVEGAKDGLFFFGTNGRQASPWGNGTSYQCVVPPVKRAGLQVGRGTVGLCDGSFARDLNAFWCPTCPKPTSNPGAGSDVQAQLWYRDPQNTSNQPTSLSEAIEFGVAP